MDVTKAASNYLTKTCLKIKAIASSPHLPPTLSAPTSQPTDAATLNVIARLCKSNPVRDALPQILRSIEASLGIEASRTQPRGQDRRSAGTTSTSNVTTASTSRKTEGSSDTDLKHSAHAQVPTDSTSESSEFEGFDDDMATASDSESYAEYDDRLASGSESHSRTPSPEPHSRRLTTSSLLPSLSSGYIPADSDSDPDAEFDDLNGPDGAAKKNRRGQRARRQIAEKKYGANAKHVIAEANGTGRQTRDAGWDARRGATDGPWRGAGRGRGGGFGGRGGGRGGFGVQGREQRSARAGALAAQPKHRDDDGKLHPSWEAAKKRKEAAAGGASQARFTGTKISFD